MEREIELIDDQAQTGDLQLTGSAIGFLKEIAKWANFLSIVGFIGLGLMIIAALFIMAAGSGMRMYGGGIDTAVLGFVYLIMAGLYLFPLIYLYKFAAKTKDALAMNSSEGLAIGIENLKSHYKFLGIFTIVILSIYALVFIGGLFSGLAG